MAEAVNIGLTVRNIEQIGGEKAVEKELQMEVARWIRTDFMKGILDVCKGDDLDDDLVYKRGKRAFTQKEFDAREERFLKSARLQSELAMAIAALPNKGKHGEDIRAALERVANEAQFLDQKANDKRRHQRNTGKQNRDQDFLTKYEGYIAGTLGVVTLFRALSMIDGDGFGRTSLSLLVADESADVHGGTDLVIDRGEKGVWLVQVKALAGEEDFSVYDLDRVNSVRLGDRVIVKPASIENMRREREKDVYGRNSHLMCIIVPRFTSKNIAGSVMGGPKWGVANLEDQLVEIGFI